MGSLPGSDDEMLTAEAAATLLGVLPITIYRWCRSGRLRCNKPGKAWRIRRADLAALAGGTASPRTLEDHLAGFLTVPDQLLLLAEDQEVLRRFDAAVFVLAAARGGLLVKAFDPGEVSRYALANAFRGRGLDVDGLEAAGRLRWLAESDPAAAVVRLGAILAEAPTMPVWAVLDWSSATAAEAAVQQQDALGDLVADHPLVVVTGVVEPEPDRWPPLEHQWRVLRAVRGVVRLGRVGLVLSRVSPAPP